MIVIRATVKGEPDVLTFTRVFEYGTRDEEIFFSSVAMIEEKLRCGMRVNVNEALILFSSHVAKSIRAGDQDRTIRDSAAKILSSETVLIGVAETLQQVTFEARIDHKPVRTIVLKDPIAPSDYIVAG